jgi:hypothetical protein
MAEQVGAYAKLCWLLVKVRLSFEILSAQHKKLAPPMPKMI